MKKLVSLIVIFSFVLPMMKYKEISISDFDRRSMDDLAKLGIALDHVHWIDESTIKFAISSLAISIAAFASHPNA